MNIWKTYNKERLDSTIEVKLYDNKIISIWKIVGGTSLDKKGEEINTDDVGWFRTKKDLNPFELPKALPNNVLYESLESKQEITLEEVAERLKGKELFKESNVRARKVLSEIKSLSIAETPEEAAQKRFPINHNLSILERVGLNSAANMGFIEGAKWQAERMYSEEEVKEILFHRETHYIKTAHHLHINEWFEQFKKLKENIEAVKNTIEKESKTFL